MVCFFVKVPLDHLAAMDNRVDKAITAFVDHRVSQAFQVDLVK
jgi:hypothetical protein